MNIAQRGVKYNTEFHRWEVYGQNSVKRAGEWQPLFVAPTERECLAYIERCKEVERCAT